MGNEGADGLANQGCLLPAQEDRDWEFLETELRRSLNAPEQHEPLPHPPEDVPEEPYESISVALQRRREKSRLTESPSPIPPPTSSQTRPIVIPTEKKWAAYEELPPGWVIDSDSSSASSSVTSSISFPSTSASLSSESLSAHQSDGYESNRSSIHAAQSDEDLSVSLLVYPLQSDTTFDYQQGFLASDAELEEELREHED